MPDHQYFTVEQTALTIPQRGAMAIYCGEVPRSNDDGTTTLFMRAPLLLLPPDMIQDGEEVLAKVVALLNDNAHLFFDSAAPSAALAGEPANGAESFEATDAALAAIPRLRHAAFGVAVGFATHLMERGQSERQAASICAKILLDAAWAMAVSGTLSEGQEPRPGRFVEAARAATERLDQTDMRAAAARLADDAPPVAGSTAIPCATEGCDQPAAVHVMQGGQSRHLCAACHDRIDLEVWHG